MHLVKQTTMHEDGHPIVRITERSVRTGEVLVFTTRNTTYELGIIHSQPNDILAVALRSTSNGYLTEGERVRLMLVDRCESDIAKGQCAHFFTPEKSYKFHTSLITGFEVKDPRDLGIEVPFNEYPRAVEAIEMPHTEPPRNGALAIVVILAAVALLGALTYLIGDIRLVP